MSPDNDASTAGLRIGSLCSGYRGLDMAVEEVFGGTTAWVCDVDPGASMILAHHLPNTPNLGDLTAVDWDTVEPVDVLAMGFPCQDVSVAGLRAGLLTGNRSGLWRHCARAIAALNPSLVVIENVPGLLSSRADGDVEPCPWCVGDLDAEPPLRALGAVLADLHGLGFDAEWTSLPASEVGACHKRNRVFIIAWPSHPEGPRLEDGREGPSARGGEVDADASRLGRGEGRPEPARLERRLGTPGGGRAPGFGGSAAPSDASDLRCQRGGAARQWGPRPSYRDRSRRCCRRRQRTSGRTGGHSIR